jgi:ElaA protein
MIDIRWTVQRFGELSSVDLYALLGLRADVFVVEQNCIYRDIDGLDPAAVHVLGRHGDELIAYARILPPGADGLPHIGRVVVHPDFRRQGLAGRLMERCLDALAHHHGSRRSALSAQAHLVGFYARHGYVPQGSVYDLDGIPHVDMRRDAP